MILHLDLQLFHFKTLPVCSQYPFQPVKFVNYHLVVPSPCETEPYNTLFV